MNIARRKFAAHLYGEEKKSEWEFMQTSTGIVNSYAQVKSYAIRKVSTNFKDNYFYNLPFSGGVEQIDFDIVFNAFSAYGIKGEENKKSFGYVNYNLN